MISEIPCHQVESVTTETQIINSRIQEYQGRNVQKPYYISLARNSNFVEIAKNIREQEEQIQELKLKPSRGQDEPNWNSEPVRQLFENIAAIRALQHLTLQNFGMHSNSLPLSMVNALLSTSASLKSLSLSAVSLIGTCNDVSTMAGRLQKHQALQSFRLSYCGFSTASSASCSLDPLLSVLSSLPSLEIVEIWGFHFGALGSLAEGSLGGLIRKSKSLRSLHIEGFELDDNLIQDLSGALQVSSSLQKLDLHVLKCSDAACTMLTDSLYHNQTLQYLELFLSTQDDKKGTFFLTKLAKALQSNKSVKELRIHSYQNVSPTEEEAFANMLEQNQRLQFLHLSGYEGDCRPKIEYFLSWNRRGRQPGQFFQRTCQMAAHQKARQQQETEHEARPRGSKWKSRSHLNRPTG